MADSIKNRLYTLRAEADAATGRAEKAEAEARLLRQEVDSLQLDIESLRHRLSLSDARNEKNEELLQEYKTSSLNSEDIKKKAEIQTKKVQLLEEELDAAKKNVRETVEKLRQVEVRAQHFEEQVFHAEKERDAWENKYDVLNEKYRIAQTHLDDLDKTRQDLKEK